MPGLDELFRSGNPLDRNILQTLEGLSRQTSFPATRSALAEGPKISAQPKKGLGAKGEEFFDWLEEVGEKYGLGPKLEATPIGAVAGWLLGAGHPAGALIGAAGPWLGDTKVGEEIEKNVPPFDMPMVAAAPILGRRGFLGALGGGAVKAGKAPELLKGLRRMPKTVQGNPEVLALLQDIVNTKNGGVLNEVVNSVKNGVVNSTVQQWKYFPANQGGSRTVPVPKLRDLQGLTEEIMGYGQMRSDRLIRMYTRLGEKGALPKEHLPQVLDELLNHELTDAHKLAYELDDLKMEKAPKWVTDLFPGFDRYYTTYKNTDPDVRVEFFEHDYTSLRKWRGPQEAVDFEKGLEKASDKLWKRREDVAVQMEKDQESIQQWKREQKELKEQIEQARYQRKRRGEESTTTPGMELQRTPLQLPGGGRLMRYGVGPTLGLGLQHLYQRHVNQMLEDSSSDEVFAR